MKRNNIRINKEAAFPKHRNVNRRIQKTGFIANILSHSQGKKNKCISKPTRRDDYIYPKVVKICK